MSGNSKSGFSLVELALVVVIIAMLNAIAIPAIARIQSEVYATRLAQDFRVIRDSLEVALSELGNPPPDGLPGRHPKNLLPYLPAEVMKRSITNAEWDWENWAGRKRNFELGMTLRMRRGLENDPLMQRVDATIDDGDLSTGSFQKEFHFGGYVIILK